VQSDLSKPEDIRSAFEKVVSETDRLDYVVNVAGIDSKYSLTEGDEAKWQKLIDLNLRGYYLVIREALPLLRAGSGRSIVNVSSINYRLGIPRRSIYSISKAGILGLTTGLARELGAEGIRINSVSPGWVFTDRQVAEYFTREQDREKYLRKLKERQSIDREISPEDVANHILFYLSEASAASTGHNCVVDAGWLLE
jgi:NAD(P)-dependent dehydrogenase (short-subunit alcohol dehydrogenase family)